MRLGEQGEAFFVSKPDQDSSPLNLASPISTEYESPVSPQPSVENQFNNNNRRKRLSSIRKRDAQRYMREKIESDQDDQLEMEFDPTL